MKIKGTVPMILISDQTNKNETNKSKIRKDFNPFIGKYGVYQI